MDYNQIGSLCVEIVKNALPLGIIFNLVEMCVRMFLNFAFPRSFKGGI